MLHCWEFGETTTSAAWFICALNLQKLVGKGPKPQANRSNVQREDVSVNTQDFTEKYSAVIIKITHLNNNGGEFVDSALNVYFLLLQAQ